MSGHWDDKKRSAGMTPSCPVHLATNIKKFTKRKKRQRNPVVRVLTLYYCKWRCNNVLTLSLSAIWLNVEKIKKTCSRYNFM